MTGETTKRQDSAAEKRDVPPMALMIPGDVAWTTGPYSVTFDGSREALLALAGNLRRLAITIEREARV